MSDWHAKAHYVWVILYIKLKGMKGRMECKKKLTLHTPLISVVELSDQLFRIFYTIQYIERQTN